MGFGFKQPLVGEKRCVTTLITAAEETNQGESFKFVIINNQSQKWVARWPHGYNSALDSGSTVRVRALAWNNVFCSCARHYSHSASLHPGV